MLTSRFENALVFASQLHREQRRKGSNVPYVSHLLAVVALVIEHGGDEDEAIAALLHDAVEDQGGPLAYIAGISGKSASVRLVSAADKLHNARCILGDYRAVGDEVWERFRGSREETLWYYREVTKALIRSGRTPLVDELERVGGEIERLAGR